MQKAEEGIRASGVIRDTPMLHNVGYLFDLPASVHLSLKLESMQAYGSFKIRGVTNQFNNLAMEGDKNDLKLITFSAGNYGKAFSVLCNRMNYNGKVLLPDHAPESRIQFIRVCYLIVSDRFNYLLLEPTIILVDGSRYRESAR